MSRGLRVFLVLVVVLCVLALAADRVTAALAQSAVASRMQQDLSLADKPSVAIHGFPFLTQLAAGRYSDVEVRADGLTAQQLTGLAVHAHLRGLRAPLSQVMSGRLSELPVDRVDGSLLMPYSEIARLAGVVGLSLSQEGDWVRVQGRVSVLGQTVTATARARVEVGSGALAVTADQGSVLGMRLPDALLAAVARGLSFTLPAPRLPLGLRLTGARPAAGGLEVSALAEHVVLRPGEIPTGR